MSVARRDRLLLAGDVGGTKIDLGIFSEEKGPRAPLAQQEFRSAGYPSLEAVVRDFLANVDGTVERACFGVAGPVIRGRAKITNLPWTLDAEHIQRELRLARIDLINDLQAIASAVPRLLADEIHTLNPGEAVAGGSIAVIAPGTGLGEAFLTWNGAAYTAHPSEGGHSDFAPTDSSQIGLLHYMLQRHSHVSYERAARGWAFRISTRISGIRVSHPNRRNSHANWPLRRTPTRSSPRRRSIQRFHAGCAAPHWICS